MILGGITIFHFVMFLQVTIRLNLEILDSVSIKHDREGSSADLYTLSKNNLLRNAFQLVNFREDSGIVKNLDCLFETSLP